MMNSTQQLLSLLLLGLVAATASAKTGQTYYTPAEVATIRERAKSPEYQSEVNAIKKAAAILADRSDEDIWNMVPPADLTRALTVRYQLDCPVHGAEVYKVGGRFPWITYADKPYKVECPVGHEVYPSNDFDAYLKAGRKEKLDVHEKYVDDGDGYIDAEGNHYFFAGYYNFWHLWRKTLIDGTASCGNAYLVTGDPKYAHKAAVALASISRVYPQMDYSKQAYHNGKWPAGINGRVLDYIWENQTVGAYAISYDQIFPTLADDVALKKLAADNGVPDVQAGIEKNILQEMASDLLAKKIWGNRFELRSMAQLALVLDNHDASKGWTTEQIVDYLTKGGGEFGFVLYNGFDRDGWGAESSLSYSVIWNVAALAAVEDLSRLGVDLAKDPKWRSIAKAPINTRLLDDLAPRLGDVDGHIKARHVEPPADLLTFGVTHFQDADCAKALLKDGEYKAPLLARHSLNTATLKKLAVDAKFPLPPYTRDLGGYGLAILELNDGAETHSATLYYGSPYASHGHTDRLTMSYHLAGRDVFSELGYPSQWGAPADWWAKNTTCHYCVLVDEQSQPSRYAGFLTRFADLDGLKLAEAQANRVWANPPPPPPVPKGSIGGEVDRKPPPKPAGPYKPEVSDYRRVLALLDSGEKSTLVVEGFFVTGGKLHDYSFHGLPYGEFSVQNSKVIREQTEGTLAGKEVEWGVDPGQGRAVSGYQFLSKPKWYEATDSLHVTWKNDEGLNQYTWFPKISFDEVIVAEGKPPVYPGWPATMPFILLRHKAQDVGLQSLFLSVTDAGKKDSSIRSVKPIKSNSPKAGGALIELASGNLWRVYINGSETVAQFDDQTQSSIGFAAIKVENGKPAKAYVIGSGELAAPGIETIKNVTAKTMQVKSVDYRKGTAIVSGEVPPIPANGKVLLTSFGDGHKGSYTARSASKVENGSELSFGETTLLTGRFEAAWNPEQKKIVSKELIGSVYNQFVSQTFVGMSVVNEDHTAIARISAYDIENNTFTIDTDEKTAEQFDDRDHDGHAYVYIADIAPGVSLTDTPARVVDLKEKK